MSMRHRPRIAKAAFREAGLACPDHASPLMIRLQKLLAAAGLGSRRSIEQWIRDGRVTIGGRLAQLGDRASPQDEVCLDGRKLELHPAQLATRDLLLYHKPVGEVTTRSDPQGRPTVFERLPPPGNGRWITVGRLDVNTSGLLLFTTDGELAHRLMHPSSEIEREYLVRVRGRPQPGLIRQLLEGVELDDGTARFDRVTQEIGEGDPLEHAHPPNILDPFGNSAVHQEAKNIKHQASEKDSLQGRRPSLPFDGFG